MLSGYRCLDLCNEQGFFAGKLLGDMGTDVIKVEKPGGDPSRRIGPFIHQEVHPEKSLYWLAFNVNKRGITLNLETPEGRDIFRKLVSKSDMIMESFSPGVLDQLGLGYNHLKRLNPNIILTSITPFGQNGPYRNYNTSDLISMGMGGITWLIGDPDRPPVTVGFPQAFLFGGTYAAMATLIALYHREVSGEGQHIDVSIQQSLIPVTLNTIPHWTLNKHLVKRAGNRRSGLTSGAAQRQTWQCKDGFVTLTIYGGARGSRINNALVQWMDEEGMATGDLKKKDWSSFDLAKVGPEDWEIIEEPIAQFFLRHTRKELYQEAVKRGVMLFPVYEFKDLLSDQQLKERGFWVKVNDELPEAENMVYPGAFARCSETPIKIRRPAPGIGEHNLEIYHDELGISEERIHHFKQTNVI